MAVAGAGLMSESSAFALSVPAFPAGKVVNPIGTNNDSCMIENNGGAENICPGQQIMYEIPLMVNQGSHSVTVSGYNNGGGAYWCQLIATTWDGDFCPSTGCTASQQTPLNTTKQIAQFTVGPVTVPYQGSLYLECNINPLGRIIGVNYNQ